MKYIVITPAETVPNETLLCNLLFENGLQILHLRKPGASREMYEDFIRRISPLYRNKIVLHEHYELASRYRLKGIHLKSGQAGTHDQYTGYPVVSISCHSVEEIETLPFRPEYCFLSPLFDSISKKGYVSRFASLPYLRVPVPVIALGGITPDKVPLCRQHGFSGVAALGYIWEEPEEALSRFSRFKTPVVLSIAGFDPSSGAGVTADLKTFENCGAYGLGVVSALTFQNEKEYAGGKWIDPEDIFRQCELLFNTHRPEIVKIGLVRDFHFLETLISFLKARIPELKIIWDPVLKSTSGTVFHRPAPEWKKLLAQIDLITPNSEELKILFGAKTDLESLRETCRQYDCRILWKGGHNEEKDCRDQLISSDTIETYTVRRGRYDKHGTGCVLSSAVAAFWAQLDSLPSACNKAQVYISRFIDSNDSRLGFHTLGVRNCPPKPPLSQLRVQYITDHRRGMTVAEQVEAVCRGGIRWIQLRMKEAGEEEFRSTGKLIREICRHYNALFIVNDRVDLARQLNADGVHLGKEDMDPDEARKILGPGKIIGATCNTWEDVQRRAAQKVDYIGLGPFAFTTTKKRLSPLLGLEGYRHILSLMRKSEIFVPVFAIGGITKKDIPFLLKTGIQGIALSGLIKNSPDMEAETRDILKLLY